MNYFRIALLHSIALGTFVHAAETPTAVTPPATGSDSAKLARPSIVGIVTVTGGKGVAGAVVFVDIAWPKAGRGVLCPSCYADCTKKVTTDAEGRFRIDDLDPNLCFRLLAAVKGFQPTTLSVSNPGERAVTIKLKATKGGKTADKRATGRVLNPEGLPVEGAVVTVNGLTIGSTTWGGATPAIQSVAVTDADGRFTLCSTKEFDRVNVHVNARGLAQLATEIAPGDDAAEIRMKLGASVSGILVRDGKPVADAVMCVKTHQTGRDDNFLHTTVVTNDAGRFSFYSLPAGATYQLCAAADSMKGRGAVKPREIKTGADESDLDLGKISVEPGLTIAGKVKLTDGNPFPEHTRIMLSRQDCWDQSIVELAPDGAFSFTDVAPGEIDLSPNLTGYRPTRRNSINPVTWSPVYLGGRVTGNKTGLVLEFEPGGYRNRGEIENNGTFHGAETSLPKELPAQDTSALQKRAEERRAMEENRRAEFNAAKSVHTAGKVTDAENPPKPVAGAKVEIAYVIDGKNTSKHGWSPDRESPLAGKVVTTNADGRFDFEDIPGRLMLVCHVTAPGFERARVNLRGGKVAYASDSTLDRSSGDIRMKPVNAAAVSVQGAVTDPTGAPVIGAVVQPTQVETKKTGMKFPYPDSMYREYVSDGSGRFDVRIPETFDKLTVKVLAPGFAPAVFKNLVPGANAPALGLVRGARVSGRLEKDGKPLPGVVMLSEQKTKLTGTPCETARAVTDAEGRFVFEHLSPNLEYIVFPSLESITPVGACAATYLPVLKNDSAHDLGTLRATEGVRLAGRIIATNGKLPEAVEIMLRSKGREGDFIWDSLYVECDGEGRFELPHVNRDGVSLTVRATGMRMTARTASGHSIDGKLEGDKTDLVIELEPANGVRGEIGWPELHGAELATK